MAIRISGSQRWNIIINDEQFEFENRKEMEKALKVLLDLKEKKIVGEK